MAIRLLHLTSGNLFGGIENSLLTIARFAAQSGALEPRFVVCFEGRLSKELRELGAPVHFAGNVRVRFPWQVVRARRRLAEILATERPDVVVCHSCWPHAVFAPAVLAAGYPLVFWAHDGYLGRHWLDRWSRFTRPHLVIANSEFTRGLTTNLFPDVRSVAIHQPVQPRSVDRAAARARVRASLGTPDDAVVIAQACRLETWKGHRLLIDGLAKIADVPGWVAWIAGGVQRPSEAAYLAELQERAASAGVGDRVRFLGQRSDVPEILAAADLHCQPNTGPEPFGVAFVEALSAGLPVVTTALGGALEIVDDRSGILVPPGDAGALAGALRRVIGDPDLRRRLGEAAPARAREVSEPIAQLRKIAGALSTVARTSSARPGPAIQAEARR